MDRQWELVFDEVPHILFRRYGTNTSVDGGNLKKRINHELRYFSKCRDQRYKTVQQLFELPNIEFDKNSKEFLLSVCKYKNSNINTLSLMINPKLDCGIILSNLINRITILFRCF